MIFFKKKKKKNYIRRHVSDCRTQNEIPADEKNIINKYG